MSVLERSMSVVNARMYAVNAACKADWHVLLQRALCDAELDWPIVDFDAPAPLSALWDRDDLGAALMCGLPFARRVPRPTLVAAPLPSPARYGGRPVYCTDIVVAADSPHRTLEATFGGVVGITVPDSMSGAVALRAHLLPLRTAHGTRLYRRTVDQLINARGVIDALLAGRIDVGPLDSYSHDLLAAYEPALSAQVRTVASTAWRPIPPLVATAQITPDELARLRHALLAMCDLPEMAETMTRLRLVGFAVPDAADYDALATVAAPALLTFEDL
jgi:ABC-type phosphate/phosphonate transport system substrate-binding protein